MKRLYMTATQRVFAENIRKRMAEQGFDGQSYSMDDEATFGPPAYRMSFADAVADGWLTDYRVVVIATSEEEYLRRAKDNPIRLDDDKLVDADTVVRLAGCWDALATPKNQQLNEDRDLGELTGQTNNRHARSAIAFASRIKDSQRAELLWPKVANWHQSTSKPRERNYLSLNVTHLDAKTPALQRGDLIESLRNADNETQCRLLTNVGVLSEGVDVPALDAIVFLQSRSSPIDVTQAVGRVMRRAEGKDLGFVIVPIVVPQFGEFGSDESIEHLLSMSDFRPVWDIIRALRSHDERIDHMLEARTMPIELRIPSTVIGERTPDTSAPKVDQTSLLDAINQLNRRFGSMMLDVCGDRHMYPNWGDKAGVVSDQIRIRLDALVANHKTVRDVFELLHKSLQVAVSPNISFNESVRMVAHHLVTVPVFDEMFGLSRFVDRNPITQSMTAVLEKLYSVGADFEREREPLQHAYRMMNNAFKSAENPRARLDVLRQIFDGFFRKAIPDEVKTMGIAYTPIELVDFMVKFVDGLCRSEFGCGLTAEGVHILDPFAGTGTFLAHMLECKDDAGEYLIRDSDLERKYAKELHANELVLLAYYIAALKIEETKHRRIIEYSGESDLDNVRYDAFRHIVLADTFHMGKGHRSEISLFGDLGNNTRAAQDQIDASIQVIIGNPPWSTGKDDASENIGKVQYPEIAARTSTTYVRALKAIKGKSVGVKAAGNLYVSAFRWATDRVLANREEMPSIVAFISPNSLTDGPSLAGMRKVLRDEFSDIYVVNLRGNAYKAGEEFKKEGDKIFGAASRNGVQITFLVRNPIKNLKDPARLHYALVPEYFSLEQKFAWIKDIQSKDSNQFNVVPVVSQHDWINLQSPKFDELMHVCKSDESPERRIVDVHCLGVTTNCDVYVYDFCRDQLIEKMQRLIEEFNRCADAFELSGQSVEELDRLTGSSAVGVIKWTGRLIQSLKKGIRLRFDETKIRVVLYRPFTKCWLYEDYDVVSAGKSASRLFPLSKESTTEQNTSNAGGSKIVRTTTQLPFGIQA